MKIVKYSATWCTPCKMFAPVAAKVANEMGIEMEEVVIDLIPDPPAFVTSVPLTHLVDEEGTVVAELMGAKPAREFKKWIEDHRG